MGMEMKKVKVGGDDRKATYEEKSYLLQFQYSVNQVARYMLR